MSHDMMASFFSGTDLNTLKSEGYDSNHFVSLIVNNAGSYTAAITKKISYTSKGKSTLRYNTFDNVPVEEEEKDFEKEETVIEYYPLTVIKEEIPEEPKSELELRLEEVRANANSYINRREQLVTTTTNIYNNLTFPKKEGSESKIVNLPHINIPSIKEEKEIEEIEPMEASLFTKEEMEGKDKEVVEEKEKYVDLDMSIAYDEDHIDPTITEQTVTQIITGDVFSIFKQNIDINKWATNMETLYNKRFGDPEQYDSFDYWVDSFLEFLENELFDEDLIKKGGRDYLDAIWAYDVIVKLQDLPKNKYLDKFIESLERWLI